jgi:hypothetical protein
MRTDEHYDEPLGGSHWQLHNAHITGQYLAVTPGDALHNIMIPDNCV